MTPKEKRTGVGYDGYGNLAVKPMRDFLQVDGWVNVEPGDCVMVPDDDGDVLTAGPRREPQNSDTTVRVLVADGAEPVDVVRVLRKQLQWLENDLLHRGMDK